MTSPDTRTTPYRFASISTHIYNHLKMGILNGSTPPGHRLLVLDIAHTFSVSQAPVREALERLKQEGLIQSRPNKGSVVADITAEEIRDVYALREMLEGYAIRESANRLTQDDYRKLEGIVVEMAQAIRTSDYLGLLQLDMDFHGFFYERCGNHLVLETWDRMKMKVMRFMAISNRHYDTNVLIGAHSRLIEALKSGPPEEAQALFLRHMEGYQSIPLQKSGSISPTKIHSPETLQAQGH